MSNVSVFPRHKVEPVSFGEFGRMVIGFDQLLDSMQEWAKASNTSSGYPPHNIIKRDDDHYELELAVSGFGDQDLSVTVANGVLTVRGERVPAEDAEQVQYLHRGLSSRKFQREFRLGPYLVVTDAVVVNGVLRICLQRQLPEELRPREIAVRTNN